MSVIPRIPKRIAAAVLACTLAVTLGQAADAHEFKAGAIEIDHPWSRATPTGAKVAGGYVTLKNEGATPDRLVSATAAIAGRTEIHEMAVKDGVMTMRPLSQGVEVPAGAEVALAPGGVHLMFFDLKTPPKKGESFAGTLTFEKAGTVEVEFAVEAIGAAKPAHGAAAPGGDHSGH